MSELASAARARLGWPADSATHRRIRRLWQRHSIAEDRRDIDGLIATLTPDCVYEIVGSGLRWDGHAGARRFYGELFAAFPDNVFRLSDIVIGPQGVFEAATLTASHHGFFAGLEPTGRRVELPVAIHFPWVPEAGLFGGERIFLDRTGLSDRRPS
jgi:predicted ester cyclase